MLEVVSIVDRQEVGDEDVLFDPYVLLLIVFFITHCIFRYSLYVSCFYLCVLITVWSLDCLL